MVQTRGPDKRRATRKDIDEPVELKKRVTSAKKTKTPTKTPVKTPTKPKASPMVVKSPKRSTSSTISISENDILSAKDNGQLVSLINQLTSTAQDELFTNYKLKSKLKIEQDELAILRLEKELKEKDELIQRLRESPEKPDMFVSPIRKRKNVDEDVINREDITKELNTVGVILDMVQLLTGLKVINHDQDEHKFYFDVLHSSTVDKGAKVAIEYRLVIIKKLASATEVNYIPTFLDDDTQDKDVLKEYLPEYFCDNLTFPYATLSQFYSKMSKALNKVAMR